jgi:hypothetical protein
MIEKIYHKKKLYALIVRAKFRKKKGINFFTEDSDIQQFGYLNHNKGHIIRPLKDKILFKEIDEKKIKIRK